MELKEDSIRFDEKQGTVLFEIVVDGTEVTVKMPDIYLQDFFSCEDPSIEYNDCISDHKTEILERIQDKLTKNLREKDGSILIGEDS